MDFDTILDNLPIIIAIVTLVILQLVLRKRRGGGGEVGTVRNLLMEIKLNKALADNFQPGEKPRKFNVTIWKLKNKQLDFLDNSLRVVLTDAYMIIDDFNRQIDVARKYKSLSYAVSLDPERLKKLLTQGEKGLEDWLTRKGESKQAPLEPPGMLDGLTGWKR